MNTKKSEQNASSDSPFYLTKFWFDTLNKNVFPDCPRINLELNGQLLAHVDTTIYFKFLKLNAFKSLTNYYSPDFLPEQFDGSEKEFDISTFYYDIQTLCNYDLIDLTPLSESSTDGVINNLSQLGFYCEKYQVSTNWTHPEIKSVEEFWQLRPSKMKNTLKRKKDKILKTSPYEIRILNQTNNGNIEQMLQDYHEVYSKSWKKNEPYNNFIDDIAREEHKKGRLRLGVLYYNNQAVAAQIWFIFDKTAYIFKLSYDDTYRTESFGSILMEALFNHVISVDHVTTVDFLTGDDKYKADWMTVSRPLFGIKAYNKKTLKGLICAISVYLNNIYKSKRNVTATSEG
jgi:hypothetical protein